MGTEYYASKIETLRDIFGATNVDLGNNFIEVDHRRYPVIDDVIVVLHPSQWPVEVRNRVAELTDSVGFSKSEEFARDIQFTFGKEWQRFSEILPSHKDEFYQYFDLLNVSTLQHQRVCDLGCGIGRWSYFLQEVCREIVLVDFSEAIFVARTNLASASNALFFMGDIKALPFRTSFADLIICLGVLHHLPTDALQEVRRLGRFAPRLLVYLYYALDNRPAYFRMLLGVVSSLRVGLSKIRNGTFRERFSWLITYSVYLPFVLLGKVLKPVGLASYIPLYERYVGRSPKRIQQDVYDRFFTSIEQRFSRDEIMRLTDTFSQVRVSPGIPYWHFICES